MLGIRDNIVVGKSVGAAVGRDEGWPLGSVEGVLVRRLEGGTLG